MIRIRLSNIHKKAFEIKANTSYAYTNSTLYYMECEDAEKLIKILRKERVPYIFAEARYYKFNEDKMLMGSCNSSQVEAKLLDYTPFEAEQLNYYKVMSNI